MSFVPCKKIIVGKETNKLILDHINASIDYLMISYQTKDDNLHSSFRGLSLKFS